MSVSTKVIKNALLFSSLVILPELAWAGGGAGGGGVRSASVPLSLLPLLMASITIGLGAWLRSRSK